MSFHESCSSCIVGCDIAVRSLELQAMSWITNIWYQNAGPGWAISGCLLRKCRCLLWQLLLSSKCSVDFQAGNRPHSESSLIFISHYPVALKIDWWGACNFWRDTIIMNTNLAALIAVRSCDKSSYRILNRPQSVRSFCWRGSFKPCTNEDIVVLSLARSFKWIGLIEFWKGFVSLCKPLNNQWNETGNAYVTSHQIQKCALGIYFGIVIETESIWEQSNALINVLIDMDILVKYNLVFR